MDKVCLALPGGRFYEVPRDVLEKYAVAKDKFQKEVARKWRAGETVFDAEVQGQEDDDGGGGTDYAGVAYGYMRSWVNSALSDDSPPPMQHDSVMGVRG